MSESEAATTTCRRCGGDMLAERADLGYDYCTRPPCQRGRRRPPRIRVDATNKSGDTFWIEPDLG